MLSFHRLRYSVENEKTALASLYGNETAERIHHDMLYLSKKYSFTFPRRPSEEENCTLSAVVTQMPIVYWMCALSMVEFFKLEKTACGGTNENRMPLPSMLYRLLIERVCNDASNAIKLLKEINVLCAEHSSSEDMREIIEDEITSSLLPQLRDVTSSFVESLDDVLDEFYCSHTSETMKQPFRHFSFLENFYSTPVELMQAKSMRIDFQGMAGGEEAWHFARELRDMYFEYLLRNGRGFHTEKLKCREGEKVDPRYLAIKLTRDPRPEPIHAAKDYHALSRALFADTGVHRIQRVPETESSGRMHTSTASICIIPEISSERKAALQSTAAVEEISLKDLEGECDISWTHGSGPGGQAVNTGYNCCVLFHRPTRIALKCHQGRSVVENKQTALKNLREKLYAKEEARRKAKLDQIRRVQAHTGERNEKIRSFNEQHNTVIDHRTQHKIEDCEGMLTCRDYGHGLLSLHAKLLGREEAKRRMACVLELQQALFEVLALDK